MRTLVALFAAVTSLACAHARASDEAAPPVLSVDEVAARLGKPGFYVFDDNPKDHFAKEHVPGAKWVASSDVKPGDLPSDRSATLVFYCANEL